MQFFQVRSKSGLHPTKLVMCSHRDLCILKIHIHLSVVELGYVFV